MSFLTSDFNLCIFEMPKDFNITQSALFDKLIAKKFKEISPSEERCHGWVSPEDMFKPEFTMEDISAGILSAIGYRYDSKKVSGSLIKRLYKERLIEYSKTNFGKKISKEEKKIIKEECKNQLILKALPNPGMAGCIFDMEKKMIYLETKSPSVAGHFMQLFEQTFGVNLTTKDYDIKNLDLFLEWLWTNVKNMDKIWIDQNVVIQDDGNTFNFNSESLGSYVDQINNLKSGKKIKKLGLGMVIHDLDYKIMLNNKNFMLAIKTHPKIKHESMETAVIDNADRISTISNQIQTLVKRFCA